MPTLHFRGLDAGDRSVDAPLGETVYEVCLTHDIEMVAACGGFAACNTCRVRVVTGKLSEMEEEVEPPFLDRDDQRFGCQACIVGDATLLLDPGDV